MTGLGLRTYALAQVEVEVGGSDGDDDVTRAFRAGRLHGDVLPHLIPGWNHAFSSVLRGQGNLTWMQEVMEEGQVAVGLLADPGSTGELQLGYSSGSMDRE